MLYRLPQPARSQSREAGSQGLPGGSLAETARMAGRRSFATRRFLLDRKACLSGYLPTSAVSQSGRAGFARRFLLGRKAVSPVLLSKPTRMAERKGWVRKACRLGSLYNPARVLKRRGWGAKLASLFCSPKPHVSIDIFAGQVLLLPAAEAVGRHPLTVFPSTGYPASCVHPSSAALPPQSGLRGSDLGGRLHVLDPYPVGHVSGGDGVLSMSAYEALSVGQPIFRGLSADLNVGQPIFRSLSAVLSVRSPIFRSLSADPSVGRSIFRGQSADLGVGRGPPKQKKTNHTAKRRGFVVQFVLVCILCRLGLPSPEGRPPLLSERRRRSRFRRVPWADIRPPGIAPVVR